MLMRAPGAGTRFTHTRILTTRLQPTTGAWLHEVVPGSVPRQWSQAPSGSQAPGVGRRRRCSCRVGLHSCVVGVEQGSTADPRDGDRVLLVHVDDAELVALDRVLGRQIGE